MTTRKDSTSGGDFTTQWIGALTGPLFLGLAAWFLWGPDLTNIPQTEAVTVPPRQLSTEPLRKPLADPPTVLLGGFDQACMDCHRFIETAATDRIRTQHTHIALDHGLNNRCLNCHHDTDRSKLVQHDGTAIPFDNVEQLCAKCHGPTYRDWQKGMHGKTLGAWDANRGNQIRLTCTHCHDPHQPAFKSMVPLPGPNTLRLSQPNEEAFPGHDPSPATPRNPLRIWNRHPPLTPSNNTIDQEQTHE